jgi:hypothetical protein
LTLVGQFLHYLKLISLAELGDLLGDFKKLCLARCNSGKKKEINRKFRVATEIGSTFFDFYQVTGQLKKCKIIIFHQHEISDR